MKNKDINHVLANTGLNILFRKTDKGLLKLEVSGITLTELAKTV